MEGLFGLVVIVSLLLYMAIKLIRNQQEETAQKAREIEQVASQQRIANQMKRKLQEHQDLIDHYSTSTWVHAILDNLCGAGTARSLPHTIKIDNESISVTYLDKSATFVFGQHELANLPFVCEYSCDGLDFVNYLVKPQVAMAEAINRILSNEYTIHDNAKIWHREHDDEITFYYACGYVEMRLRPKHRL